MRILVLSIVTTFAFGITANAAEEKVDFAKQVLPIFQQNCAKCHGEKRGSAGLRLHTAAALKQKWDKQKSLIVAGKPENSELYKRLVLPKADRKHMPKGGEPLSKDKTDLIARWIKEGAALPGVAAIAAKPQAAAAAAAPKEEAKKPSEPPLPKVAPAPQAAIVKLTADGAQVMPLFANSSLLTVSFAHRSAPAGDAELAMLTGVADQVYMLNLSDSKPSDAGFAALDGLKNLATLHLERSSVTDAGLAHIAKLSNLQYLNLYGTAITDAGLSHLKGLKNLRHLYLWQTKATYAPAMGLEKDIPGLEVNLGYDNPMVVKMRLAKELTEAKKQSDEAKAALTKAQQDLDAAKKTADAATARVTDVEKQIKETEGAASGKKPAVVTKPEAAAKPASKAKAKAQAKAPAKPKPAETAADAKKK
ncbi:MAG TPA: c-type cytochrome domain-containing protein [Lacipirellulaceae bacterium]|nr:c-type cytochrome domain-containing protein [Lacipirellulaceae bacterium]